MASSTTHRRTSPGAARATTSLLDIVGNHPWSRLKRALTPEGTYVLIGHDKYGASGRRWFGSLGRFFKLMVISPFVSQASSVPRRQGPRRPLGRLEGAPRSREGQAGHGQDVPLSEVPEANRIPGIGTGAREGRHRGTSVRASGDLRKRWRRRSRRKEPRRRNGRSLPLDRQGPGDDVVESLLPFGEGDHDEPDSEDQCRGSSRSADRLPGRSRSGGRPGPSR